MTGQKDLDESGFTLPELLVAMVILGIIMVAIGAMITTSFRTTTIVRARLDGSRAPKLVSTYWVPDVEGARSVENGGGAANCGAGQTALVTFTWEKFDSVIGATAPDEATSPMALASATWWLQRNGSRDQVIRQECAAVGSAPVRTATVVPEVADNLVEVTTVGDRGYRISVSVPDTNEVDKQFEFSVDGTQAVTP